MHLQMAWCARKTSARYKFFYLLGRGKEKNVTGNEKVFKKDQKRSKSCGYPYFLCYEMKVARLLNTSLVSGCEQKLFRLNFS